MSSDFLERIVEHKRGLLEQRKAFFASLKKKAQRDTLSRYRLFKEAIARPGQINLIAEIKKASPSKGIIRQKFDAMQLAATYVKSGAAALSVLTEDKFFLGKISHIKQISEYFRVPLLEKDFIIDDVQIYEAFYLGASAILLIVAILDDKRLKSFIEIASRLDMDCLVEVHDEQELDRALKGGAEIIGINNRNLHTFEVDFDICRRLIPKIPKDKIIVAESGIKTHDEIKLLQELGANAVLIGETFLRSSDIPKKVKEVMYGEG